MSLLIGSTFPSSNNSTLRRRFVTRLSAPNWSRVFKNTFYGVSNDEKSSIIDLGRCPPGRMLRPIEE
jgi:hypothetical protein